MSFLCPLQMNRLILRMVRPLLGVMTLATSALCWSANDTGYQVETVADGLRFPWSVAWLPTGDILVAERGGALYQLAADGGSRNAIAEVPASYVRGQGGLFDVLVDQDFTANQRIYLTLAGGTPEANATELYSARLLGDRLTDVQLVHRVTPSKDTPAHYGGKLQQLPDGDLLFTTGDGFDYREQAQDVNNQLGKTIRVAANGDPSASNPSYGNKTTNADVAAYVFSYGHRNPQGLAVDSATGEIWLTEHGPRGGDELNLLQAGKNYGWPAITYGMDYVGAYVSPYTEYPGMEQPSVQWTPSIGASGLAVYRGDKFPHWQGNLFSGALVEKTVRRLARTADGWEQEILFAELNERIRDVRVGPDGYLYLLTDSDNGRLLRIIPRT